MSTYKQAAQLAKRDSPAALQSARGIADARARAQALASVARFAPDDRVETIANEGLRAAEKASDDYQRVTAACWPIRALLERELPRAAGAAVKRWRDEARQIEHVSARAEAFQLLLEAAFPGSPSLWTPIVERLLGVRPAGQVWRVHRAMWHSIMLVHGRSPALAEKFAAGVNEPKVRERIAREIAVGRAYEARAFFW